MATTVATLIATARKTPLIESTARLWSDAELVDLANFCFQDLFKAIVDLYEDYFQTVDTTNLAIAANAETMTGVPTDCYKVFGIEPANIASTGSYRNILFLNKPYTHRDFVRARAMSAKSPTEVFTMYYRLVDAGPPVAAPVIRCAPKLTTALAAGNLRLIYAPMIAAVASGGNNPIPGASDPAVVAWIGAYARSKEREDRSPDPNWLAVYDTEKKNLVASLHRRDLSEEKVAEGVFEHYWQD